MEEDSNLRRRCQQIYSLPPLATRESIQKADDRTRTDNLLITNQLLCQLSHIGIILMFCIIHQMSELSHTKITFLLFFNDSKGI